ncbi:hypothetical protein [Acidiphilium sp.]|uniref:hypothetical protein n=1 Tax=Acidiphilium sp. TaxID=527 RepID=UPI003D035C02
MTTAPSLAQLGNEYNDFLFSSVGEDPSGLGVSVLSALARQNIDPWQEAATLARLPGAAATQRLAGFIAPLSKTPRDAGEAAKTAARLIGLLPRNTVVSLPSLGAAAMPPTIAGVPIPYWRSLKGKNLLLFVSVLMILLLSLGYLVGNPIKHLEQPAPHHPAPATPASVATPKQ